MKLSSLVLLLLIAGLVGEPSFAKVTEITYANGNLLRDSDGNIFNHLGESFITRDGMMKYPSWLSGRVLRDRPGWGAYPYRLFYPNGSLLAEDQFQIYYPLATGGTVPRHLYDGWSYSYSNDVKILSNNWRDAETILHEKDGIPAWNGRQLFDDSGAPVLTLTIAKPIGHFGELIFLLDNRSGTLHLNSIFEFDLFTSSYIYPIVFFGADGLPEVPFKTFTVKIETGYWRELVEVTVQDDKVTSDLKILPWPDPPDPWNNRCLSELSDTLRPARLRNRPDPFNFARLVRRAVD